LSPVNAAAMFVALKMPITQFYWTQQLRKNGAWQRRFDAPHASA
jgi:hypothetical protein